MEPEKQDKNDLAPGVSFSGISPGKDANDLAKQEKRKEKKEKKKKQEMPIFWERLGPAESRKPGHSDWCRTVWRGGGLQEIVEDVPDGVHPAELEKKMAM